MSKVLVIVESPAKAKTIGKFLGKKYIIKASMGHIRDLPKSQLGVDVESEFEPKYITIRGKGDIIKELKAAAKKADKILLAPDPDREGEAIAWHLQRLLNIAEDEQCRIEFNEITKQAIQNAVKKPRKVDNHRVEAQQARRILDRLVGYNLSPLLWRKVRKGLSAGRVQSVAVRLISDREEEINDFVQEEYWSLKGIFQIDNKKKIEAKLEKIGDAKAEIHNQEEIDEIISQLAMQEFKVTSIKKREKKRNPAAPFTTSSLQQEAYRKLNFTSKKTMMIAQQLYEGLELGKEGSVGLVTYIRTDSTRISETAQEEAKEYIVEKYGGEYFPPEARQFTNKGKAQNAHEAIRPTSIYRNPESVKQYLSRDQHRLYKLVWERFVASQMSSAVMDVTTIDIVSGLYTFKAHGSIIKFPGFMKVYIEDQDEPDDNDEKVLPEILEGTLLKEEELIPKQHFTQPPPRYSDATLIKVLEELGIGRPSTYAPIVETIQKRGYVLREDKQFHPTELGTLVVELLKEHFHDIIDVEFTAQLEGNLDHIEEGEALWRKVLKEFYQPFKDTLQKAEDEIGTVELADEVSDEICEHCGRNLVIKYGRFGKFLACPGFPDCRNTKPLLEDTGVKCPSCNDGTLVLRRSKKGRKFYGCTDYPKCEFLSWDLPIDKPCPVCQGILVKKTTKKGTYHQCTNKECKFKELQDQDES